MEERLLRLLQTAADRQASDIHLVTHKPPIFRIHGDLIPCGEPPLSQEDVEAILAVMLTPRQLETFREERELDFSCSRFADFHFRVNAHFEKNSPAATLRMMARDIDAILKFRLPPVVKKLVKKRKGLIIISGTAGSGKSTTLTYIIDLINNERRCKIITIEDPIEFIHQSKKSLIVQREVGFDTHSFARALKFALRQDPDVVVVGEMRDFESISMALTTAETGHLVVTTVHAPNAVETINRIIDAYPSGYREQIYAQLANNLLGVISQTLVPRKDGDGRILATEVLTVDISVQNLIRRGALTELRGHMDASEHADDHTLENELSAMVRQGLITQETAREYAKFIHLLDFEEASPFHSSKTETPPRQHDAKVLLVDTSPKDLVQVADVFRRNGYTTIRTAGNGKEGWEAITSWRPDVVVIDTSIMDLDCFELCRRVKSIPDRRIEVILVTGRMHADYPQEAKSAGADDFVIKTSDFDLLTKAIQRLSSV